MLDKKDKRFSRAWAISDRSGMKFPMREMMKEPGTNVFLHKSESDGIYNSVDHPQANIQKYARFGDPYPVVDAHLDLDWVSINEQYFLVDEYDNHVTDEYGEDIYTL